MTAFFLEVGDEEGVASGIFSGRDHGGGGGAGKGHEGLGLAEGLAPAGEPAAEVIGLRTGATRESGHEVGDDVLLFAGFAARFQKGRLELFEELDSGLCTASSVSSAYPLPFSQSVYSAPFTR